MNNLHRGLAPISDAAWTQIEIEAARTLKRYLAARRVVDVIGPKGADLSAVGTGHTTKVQAPFDGVEAVKRGVQPIIELRVPFKLTRAAVDDVERGAGDSDWGPLKRAAKQIAYAEDRAVFEGFPAADILGIRQGSSNPVIALPASTGDYPTAVAQAVNQLKLEGVNGPYALVLGAAANTAIGAASDDGYPVLQHVQRLVDSEIVWAPAIEGGFVISKRSGDYELHLGQDLSIGYTAHSATDIDLYFQETFTFRMLTAEASVALRSGE